MRVCVYLDAHRVCVSALGGVECYSNDARRIRTHNLKGWWWVSGAKAICGPSLPPCVSHAELRIFRCNRRSSSKTVAIPLLPAMTVLLSNVLKCFWLWQKAPWLTYSIIYHMKIHAPHKRHILALSRLTSRSSLPAVSFRHPLRITVPNTSHLLLEFYSRRVVSFSWQSVQLCQHIHCAYPVPVVCKTPPIPSNDRCHQSRK